MDREERSEQGVQATGKAEDFRIKATLGVALTSLVLLLPFGVAHFIQGDFYTGIGTLVVVNILVLQVWLIRNGLCHQNLVLYGLVPVGMMFMIGVFLKMGVVGSLWCYPVIVSCYCMLSHRKASLANAIILVVALPLSWYTLAPEVAVRVWATLLAISAFGSVLVRVIDVQQQRLHEQLSLDPLTGLLNRRALREDLDCCIARFENQANPVTLLTLDLDHFKKVNDQFGHDRGDQVLVEVARLLCTRIRVGDDAYRTGGEEFLVLMREAGAAEGAAAAENLRRAIEMHPVLADNGVTVSIGVATLQPGEDRTGWAQRSDVLMYEAKRQGRNRVCTDRQLRAAGTAAGRQVSDGSRSADRNKVLSA